MDTYRSPKKAFTIVELVIVIAVIGILASVLIPTFSGVISSARESAALQEARAELSSLLVLTGGSLTSESMMFVDNDGDGAAERRFVYRGGSLGVSDGENAALHSENGESFYVFIVSAEAFTNGNPSAAEPKLTADAASFLMSATGESTAVCAADVALARVNGYYTAELDNQICYRIYFSYDIPETTVLCVAPQSLGDTAVIEAPLEEESSEASSEESSEEASGDSSEESSEEVSSAPTIYTVTFVAGEDSGLILENVTFTSTGGEIFFEAVNYPGHSYEAVYYYTTNLNSTPVFTEQNGNIYFPAVTCDMVVTVYKNN